MLGFSTVSEAPPSYTVPLTTDVTALSVVTNTRASTSVSLSTAQVSLSTSPTSRSSSVAALETRTEFRVSPVTRSRSSAELNVDSSGSIRTVSVSLGTAMGAAANLTGFRVSFHDEPTPDLTTVARYQSASETIDATGKMTFSFSSTLPVGGQGLLVVQGPEEIHFNGRVPVS